MQTLAQYRQKLDEMVNWYINQQVITPSSLGENVIHQPSKPLLIYFFFLLSLCFAGNRKIHIVEEAYGWLAQ